MPKSLFLTAVVAGFLGYLVGQLPVATGVSGSEVNNEALEPVNVASTSSHYICPMHAGIVADVPGSCPICSMDLVEQQPNEAADTETGLPVVKIASAVVHNLGVRTAQAAYGDLQRGIETIGKITRIDPMARRTITPPIRGELVHIADIYEGDIVDAGTLLFSVKSEQLFENEKAFQDVYLSGDRATANAMIPQLSKLGLSSEQIARLQAGEAPVMPVDVYAFEGGFVYTRRGRVGEKVHSAFTVFNVGGNYRVIEVTAEIFEQQWGWVREGQQAHMTVRGLPGTVFEGKVVRVEPPVGYTTRSLEVALKFKTDNAELSQSMFAHVSIAGQPLKNVLLVPADTVIRTGQGDRVVLMLDDNRFQPVPVIAGEEAGGMIEIRSGLDDGDRVVASGQFLIDSESSLLAGFRRLKTPGAIQPEEGDTDQHQQAESHRPQPPVSDDSLQMNQERTPDSFQPVNYIPASPH